MARYIETHASLRIYADDDGFYATNGCDQFGYHDTVEALRDEIDDYWQGSEHGPLNGIFTGANA